MVLNSLSQCAICTAVSAVSEKLICTPAEARRLRAHLRRGPAQCEARFFVLALLNRIKPVRRRRIQFRTRRLSLHSPRPVAQCR